MDAEKLKALEERVNKAEMAAKKAEEEKATILASLSHLKTGQTTGALEQKALTMFGCPSVKELFAVNTAHPDFSYVPEEVKGFVRTLKKDLDVSRAMQQIFHGESRDVADQIANVKGVLDGNYFAKHVLAPKLKAFGTDVVGAGAEWVNRILSSSYIEEFELQRQVLDQFRSINMPSSPFDVPLQKDVTIARRQTQSCTPGGIAKSNFGTGKLTMEAEKLVETMCLPEELNEDAAPDILALVRSEVVKAQSRAWETAILNGDDSNTHMDSDVVSTEDARTAWKGLRKLALANSATVDFAAGALTVAKLREMRALMGPFGVNERDLVWICSTGGYHQFLALPEVTTVDKMGQLATILRGALTALDGIPIIISEYVREDLDATGVFGGALKGVHLVNRSRFMWGVRRPINVRAAIDPNIPGDSWSLASWWRGDFQGMEQSASETSTVFGINVA